MRAGRVGAAHGGAAGQGGAWRRTGRRWVDTARRQPLLLAPPRIENTVLKAPSEAPIMNGREALLIPGCELHAD